MTDAEILRHMVKIIEDNWYNGLNVEALLDIADRLEKLDRVDEDSLGSILGEK